MSISATKMNAQKSARIAFIYLLLTLVCALLGAIYEKYSHEVYSYSMIYAFMYPLIGGALPFSGINLKRGALLPRAVSLRTYHFGIAALTTGSFVQGILEIYGTSNRLITIYWIAGAALVLVGVVSSVFDLRRTRQ